MGEKKYIIRKLVLNSGKVSTIYFFNQQIFYRFAATNYRYIYSILISSKNAYDNVVCADGLVRITNYINTQYNEKFNQNSDHTAGHVEGGSKIIRLLKN